MTFCSLFLRVSIDKCQHPKLYKRQTRIKVENTAVRQHYMYAGVIWLKQSLIMKYFVINSGLVWSIHLIVDRSLKTQSLELIVMELQKINQQITMTVANCEYGTQLFGLGAFESHWVPLSYGLVPHLSKKLSKFPFGLGA